MSRRLALLLLMLCGSLVVAGTVYGLDVLRELESFRVERIEVRGTRYLSPETVAHRSGIRPGASVFDDVEAWRAPLLALPLVEAVAFERKLPATVVITVREALPVALVAGPELRPVDAAGRFLPLDPAGRTMDLPVLWPVAAPEGDRLAAADRVSLDVLLRLEALDPGLCGRVSEVARVADGVRMRLRDLPHTDALLPAELHADGVARLRAAMADLATRGELTRARRLDLRYRDQLVVSFDPDAAG